MKLLGMKLVKEIKQGQVNINISPVDLNCEKGNTLEIMQMFIGSVEEPATINYIPVEIDGHNIDVWHDDEFLLKGRALPSMLANDNTLLCGNLVFAKANEEGETIGLDKEEIRAVLKWYPQNVEKAKDFVNRLLKEARP